MMPSSGAFGYGVPPPHLRLGDMAEGAATPADYGTSLLYLSATSSSGNCLIAPSSSSASIITEQLAPFQITQSNAFDCQYTTQQTSHYFPPVYAKTSARQSSYQIATRSTLQTKPNLKLADKLPNPATHQVRKERSRKAAQNRRGRENKEFEQLAQLLPFEQGISSNLDKASIVRLVISYLRLRSQISHLLSIPSLPKLCQPTHHVSDQAREQNYERFHGMRLQDALEGFMMIFEVAKPSRILYISQTVAQFTGLALVDFIGKGIQEYMHRDDAYEIEQQLARMVASYDFSDDLSRASSTQSLTCSKSDSEMKSVVAADTASLTVAFHVRLKCAANKRGNYFKVPGYRLFLLVGRLCRGISSNDGSYLLRRNPLDSHNSLSRFHFIGTALALPSMSLTDCCLTSDQIVFKLDHDFSILESDVLETYNSWFTVSKQPTVSKLSLYDMCHPDDLGKVRELHFMFNSKGQAYGPDIRLCSNGKSCKGSIWLAGVQAPVPSSASASSISTKQQNSPPQQANVESTVPVIAIFTPTTNRETEVTFPFAQITSHRNRASLKRIPPADYEEPLTTDNDATVMAPGVKRPYSHQNAPQYYQQNAPFMSMQHLSSANPTGISTTFVDQGCSNLTPYEYGNMNLIHQQTHQQMMFFSTAPTDVGSLLHPFELSNVTAVVPPVAENSTSMSHALAEKFY